MGNIDNINFKIILDDKDFNKQIKDDIELAQKLNTQVACLLNLKKQVALATSQMADSIKAASKSAKGAAEALESVSNATKRQTQNVNNLNTEVEHQSKLFRSLSATAAAYFSVDGVRRFATELTRVTGEFERQQTALRAILQNKSGADKLFEQIKELAVQSPFSVLDLTSYAKQLSSFSVPLNEIYDTTKMLADVSAGLGVDMSRIVLAYGQIRSASFLRGTEVRQLTEAGIPILAELAKQFSELEHRAVSVGEVFDKISARQVPFAMVEKAFKDMTSEGGKFYKMQEVLASTLAGKIGNLKDAYQIMLSNIGNANSGILKGSVDLLTTLIRNYETIGRLIIDLVAGYGAYRVAIRLANVATRGLIVANYNLSKSFIKLRDVIKAHPLALLAGIATAVAVEIGRIILANDAFAKSQKNIAKISSNFKAEITSEISSLDFLWDKLKKAKVGTEEYNAAKDAILKNYDSYLTSVDREALRVGNLTLVYKNLSRAIKDATKEKAFTQGMEDINETFAKNTSKAYSRLESILKFAPEGGKQQVLDYVNAKIKYGEIDKETRDWLNKSTIGPGGKTYKRYDLIGEERRKMDDWKAEAKELRQKLEDSLDFIYGDSEPSHEPKNPIDYSAQTKDIENKIALVKEMAALYSKMKDAGLSDKTIRGKFDEVYSESDRDLYKTFDFEKTLAVLEDRLSKANSSVANSANALFRKDKINSFTDAFVASSQALKQWLDFYNEIDDNMPESSGDSFGNRIDAILNKLRGKQANIKNKVTDAVDNMVSSRMAGIEKYGEEQWAALEEKGLNTIAAWEKAAKQANIDVAQQSLQSLGKSYLDTFFTSKGIDMNNLRDKSFGQLKSMLDALNSVDTNGLIPESVLNRAKELGIDTQPLLDFIKQSINAKKQDIFGALLGDITKQANAYSASLGDIEGTLKRIKELKSLVKFKKASGDESVGKDELSLSQETELLKAQLKSPYAYMEGISKAAGTAAKYMKDFAEATGDTNLEGIANSLSAISQNLSAAAQGGASGGWIGAVVAGVADALGQITSAIIEEKAAIAKTAEAMENFREQIYLTRFQVNEDDYETIFGTRVIAKASEAYRKAGAAMAEYKKAITTTMAAPSESEVYDTLDQTLSPKYLARMEAFKKGYTELEGLMVMTKHRSALAKSFGKKNEYAALKDLVPELFEGGEFNLENAEAFLENKNAIRYWDKYNKGVVEAIQHTVELAKANKESEAILENAVSDIFSNMASDFSDIIFDAVINGSDAWSQFREKGSEAILDLGKQLMQEMMITEYFDRFSKSIKDAYGLESPELVYNKLASIMSNMYDGMIGMVPYWEDLAQKWVDMMRNAGYDPTASGSSLSEGIKGITENTASLLASYINAIRSDVSQIRLLQTTTNSKITELLSVFPKAPTLADYLTKIEAHTANISADTSAILKQLRSVITTQGGNSAFAVYM